MHMQHDRANEKEAGALRVRVALLKAGLTQAEVARRLSERLGRGVSRQEVNRVVRGYRPTAAIRQAICEATGLTYQELWEPTPQENDQRRESWSNSTTC